MSLKSANPQPVSTHHPQTKEIRLRKTGTGTTHRKPTLGVRGGKKTLAARVPTSARSNTPGGNAPLTGGGFEPKKHRPHTRTHAACVCCARSVRKR
eukprot:7805095-Alexandrium_andersonii.AAC.1